MGRYLICLLGFQLLEDLLRLLFGGERTHFADMIRKLWSRIPVFLVS